MIPLSSRLRPDHIDQVIGQKHFLCKGSLFYNSVMNRTFDSAIFFGPSGTGKTTLARIIARSMDSDYHELNASNTGIKELKEILDRAKDSLFGLENKVTYLYIDEFHRWNKLQQDSLLQGLEEGIIKFIGATTQNPYYAINNAVLSRVRNIYEFKALSNQEIEILLGRGLAEINKTSAKKIYFGEKAAIALSDLSNGDGRVALDSLGYICENLGESNEITLELVGEALQKKIIFYEKDEDKYQFLSGLQKSIRGSNPDAAIHYLARLLEGSSDLMMIGRRLLVIASEDIGMAYPQAVSIVNACVQGCQIVGLPEGEILLAQAVILLSACPKSNSAYMALRKAQADLENINPGPLPQHLRDKNYKYPHDFGGYVEQSYLPDNMLGKDIKYYLATNNGSEVKFKNFLEGLKNRDAQKDGKKEHERDDKKDDKNNKG